jgi:hypothetical protein
VYACTSESPTCPKSQRQKGSASHETPGKDTAHGFRPFFGHINQVPESSPSEHGTDSWPAASSKDFENESATTPEIYRSENLSDRGAPTPKPSAFIGTLFTHRPKTPSSSPPPTDGTHGTPPDGLVAGPRTPCEPSHNNQHTLSTISPPLPFQRSIPSRPPKSSSHMQGLLCSNAPACSTHSAPVDRPRRVAPLVGTNPALRGDLRRSAKTL